MPELSEDTAWLDAQRWVVGMCARCDEPRAPTMAVGHIEGNSGPGYEVRFCRACVLLVVAGARAEQARGFRPRLPQALEDALPRITVPELPRHASEEQPRPLSDAEMSSILQQVAEYETPAPDPAELAADKARLMTYMDQLGAEQQDG